ncbi:MAG: DUF423 domain-containing protein [Candidatus Cohnella colombiensis]|uniref:DUF423 domain-containing protein n=1 Tax=Candidatus Cohnella colombiensis TaxID=3121368 RepID=A0AA95F1P9_9BACL|nr:MAG: DUF423 domain-containing protein [Cohnella sp.]
MKKQVVIGAIVAMLAVALGAFGAHMLKERISEDMLSVYHTGVEYQMYHGLGILIIALLMERLPRQKLARWAARLLLIGTVLFSGSLYVLALSGIKVLGAITPFGGVAFIAGWICLVLATRPAK